MRILLDECAPSALKNYFRKHGHECCTVQEAGWSGKRNGDLLNLAETNFDVLFTVDTNLRYQQNLTNRRIAIVVLQSSSNRLENLRPFFRRALRPSVESRLERSFSSATMARSIHCR